MAIELMLIPRIHAAAKIAPTIAGCESTSDPHPAGRHLAAGRLDLRALTNNNVGATKPASSGGNAMNMLNDILGQDLDPGETREWSEALAAVINHDGPERAHYLLQR